MPMRLRIPSSDGWCQLRRAVGGGGPSPHYLHALRSGWRYAPAPRSHVRHLRPRLSPRRPAPTRPPQGPRLPPAHHPKVRPGLRRPRPRRPHFAIRYVSGLTHVEKPAENPPDWMTPVKVRFRSIFRRNLRFYSLGRKTRERGHDALFYVRFRKRPDVRICFYY